MEIILDYSKWICGERAQIGSLGQGERRVLWNDYGYGCILGHVCLSCGASQEEILNCPLPTKKNEVLKKTVEVYSGIRCKLTNLNDLSWINIRDENGVIIKHIEDPMPQQRIEEIRKVFESKGHTLKVINMPIEEVIA